MYLVWRGRKSASFWTTKNLLIDEQWEKVFWCIRIVEWYVFGSSAIIEGLKVESSEHLSSRILPVQPPPKAGCWLESNDQHFAGCNPIDTVPSTTQNIIKEVKSSTKMAVWYVPFGKVVFSSGKLGPTTLILVEWLSRIQHKVVVLAQISNRNYSSIGSSTSTGLGFRSSGGFSWMMGVLGNFSRRLAFIQ